MNELMQRVELDADASNAEFVVYRNADATLTLRRTEGGTPPAFLWVQLYPGLASHRLKVRGEAR